MGFYIRALKNKHSIPNWKVQFLTYRKEYTKNSIAEKPRREWDIQKRRWRAFGFQETMTLEQARARAKQLNLQIETRRQEERRRKIEEEFETLNAKFTSVIPDVYKTEFEQKYLWGRFSNPGWRAAQNVG